VIKRSFIERSDSALYRSAHTLRLCCYSAALRIFTPFIFARSLLASLVFTIVRASHLAPSALINRCALNALTCLATLDTRCVQSLRSCPIARVSLYLFSLRSSLANCIAALNVSLTDLRSCGASLRVVFLELRS
jgi:hypothetical protein